ncbi:Crp/Fnr family transcriptional regulator [Cytophagaceae bacterium YF14B1]|uniref:Crp/Fnr family transcriptional regulator n=1 Tax=Xanthocytophaga flava TaxID=3048013 RepID=A0AAE3QWW0_9BACT|nr:Crp/Fnr family transcriptional regulator [Xanthocytophaga flavus]MDJ1485000.1 Crp/Fnr family transcriptional regulator [Xanthocytophaga flavus]
MEDITRQFLLKFNKFSSDEINLILDNTSIEKFRKGQFVVQAGSICKKCYFVLQGCLRQFRIIDGVEKTSDFFLEKEPVVLYSSYMDRKPAESSVQCLEDCILLSGTKEQEITMHKTNPSLEHLIYTLLSDDYKKAESYITLLTCFNPEQRYLALLETRPEILNRVPLVYIASYIGVTPESLSRIRKRIMFHIDKP